MLRLAFDFIITWRETRTRPNAYDRKMTIKMAYEVIILYHLHMPWYFL